MIKLQEGERPSHALRVPRHPRRVAIAWTEYREEKDVDADADGSDEEDDGEEDSGDSESGEEDGEEDGEEVGEEAEPSLAEIERSNAKRLQQLMLPERDAELRCSLRGLVNDLVP